MNINGIDVYKIYKPNIRKLEKDVIGFRYIIRFRSVRIMSVHIFSSQITCMVSARRIVKQLKLDYPDNFTMNIKNTTNTKFMI